jgi:hypothetical protein
MATGIRKLHSKGCAGRAGGRCRCGAGWEASVFSKRDSRKIRKTFALEAEAKNWRADAVGMLSEGGSEPRSQPPSSRRGRRGTRAPRPGRSATAPATASSPPRSGTTSATCDSGCCRSWVPSG